jgi:hypothetical protein
MKTLEFMLCLLSEMNILEEEEMMIFEQWNVINVTNCVFKHFYLTFFKYNTMSWRKVILNFLTLEISAKAI